MTPGTGLYLWCEGRVRIEQKAHGAVVWYLRITAPTPSAARVHNGSKHFRIDAEPNAQVERLTDARHGDTKDQVVAQLGDLACGNIYGRSVK